jgi:hypothetical protein
MAAAVSSIPSLMTLQRHSCVLKSSHLSNNICARVSNLWHQIVRHGIQSANRNSGRTSVEVGWEVCQHVPTAPSFSFSCDVVNRPWISSSDPLMTRSDCKLYRHGKGWKIIVMYLWASYLVFFVRLSGLLFFINGFEEASSSICHPSNEGLCGQSYFFQSFQSLASNRPVWHQIANRNFGQLLVPTSDRVIEWSSDRRKVE